MIGLKQRLIDEKVSTSEYSLEGGLPNEAYCLAQNEDNWEVYYSERGVRTSLGVFDNEEEACDYFYNRLVRSGLLNNSDNY